MPARLATSMSSSPGLHSIDLPSTVIVTESRPVVRVMRSGFRSRRRQYLLVAHGACAGPDVLLVLAPEMLQRRDDGPGREIGERAQRLAGHVVAHRLERPEILFESLSVLDALEYVR